MPSSLKFGTSGLRGLVVDLNGPPARDYALAFLNVLSERGQLQTGDSVYIGRDLRSSSPAIAQLVVAAVSEAGFAPVDCGAIPTPALCLASLANRAPAVMVTGSHIPDDRNGLKFYRADGEIDKQDEREIVAAHARLAVVNPEPSTGPIPSLPLQLLDVSSGYLDRYLHLFPADALAGLKVGVYQHSTVARDLLVSLLLRLGAAAVPLGRSGHFVAMDTEAVHPDDQARLMGWAQDGHFDAIVSCDGDADRPLVADERGRVIRGDLVGALSCRLLGADTIVTPMTSNSAIEALGVRVLRTAVGSPFVIAGIAEAKKAGGNVVVGFEANGGLILGTEARIDGRHVAALPTRDAFLPILCCLLAARRSGGALSGVADSLGFRAARSDRLQGVDASTSRAFLDRVEHDPALAAAIADQFGPIVERNRDDGLRMLSANGEMIYFRASGNAPELRCYVEASDSGRAEKLLKWSIEFAHAAT